VRTSDVLEIGLSDSASAIFGQGGSWTVVLEDTALPLCPNGVPEPGHRILVPGRRGSGEPPFPQTLRELEELTPISRRPGPAGGDTVSAIVFDAGAFRAEPGESVEVYLRRLRQSESVTEAADFETLAFASGFGPRPEVARHVPRQARRLLDIGCADGELSASLKRASPGLQVWGVEHDPGLAEQAASRLDRVVAGEAASVLEDLVRANERFDTFVFADVLEHLVDPIAALSRALSLASSGAALVASVPNAGHLSVVRDLLLGRFDPVPAGLLDTGHLRWFTRRTLVDVFEAASWRVEAVEPVAGPPVPGAEEFLRWAVSLPGADRESLQTYQWIVVARP
jgi:2-polyprenyl-3-methyl-5-hydroxy-6-metoxy-1,4-benzoquinol methylase